jgi:integrase
VVETPPVAPSFEQAAQEWLERYQSLFAVRRSTLANRQHFIIRHLVPFFAGRQASEITTELVEDFIGAKRAVGGSKRGKALADSTIKVNLPTLRMILDYCVRRRWLAANPLRGEALWRPTPKSEQPDPFTQPELADLAAAAESLSPAWGLMLRVWAQSGMRSGELRGLQHQDLDPRSGLVSIQRTRTQGATGPTKTARSVPPSRDHAPDVRGHGRVAAGRDARKPVGTHAPEPAGGSGPNHAALRLPQAPGPPDGGARAPHALAANGRTG